VIVRGELSIPKNIAFTSQVDVLYDLIKNRLEKQYGKGKVYLGVDNTGVGEVVSEMLRNKGVTHYKIQYVSGNAGTAMSIAGGAEMQKFYFNRNGIYYVKKPFLMDLPISLSHK